ncbi:MAG: EF-hand domain-containing protein [Planctomycetaceae bacterium]|nr:EF-hand domain-containing protein [Planctomycetaceae bacterium]
MFASCPISRPFFPLLVCIVSFCSDSCGTNLASCQETVKRGSADRATMVILAPAGPVFVDLQLTVSRIPYREWVAKFLANDMDIDQSGRLDKSELDLLTESMKTLTHVNDAAEILREMKTKTDDVAVDDFVAWLSIRIPRAFDLIAQPQAADNAVRLVSLLDTNFDGAISEQELLETSHTLRFRDLDNDETFSISELLPYRDPRSEYASLTPDAVSLPFFHVVDRESAERAATRIVQRYGTAGELPVKLLRQPKSSDSESEDRKLSVAELQRLVEQPHFHLHMDISLSVKANTSTVKVTIKPEASGFCRPRSSQKFGEFSLRIDELPLTIRALGGIANDRRSTQGYLGQSFVMSDLDRNQYLDDNEFSGMFDAFKRSGARPVFKAVDLNGDAMVTRDEVFSFARREQTAAASRIEVSVRQGGKTLFGILDRNDDRRLSAREIQNGSAALQEFDTNQDHQFADSELGTEFVLTISLGRPEFRRASGQAGVTGMQADPGDAILPGGDSLPGPAWFRCMDRNQDGDVSRREFPGTVSQFMQIDTDEDELISAVEAAAVSQ